MQTNISYKILIWKNSNYGNKSTKQQVHLTKKKKKLTNFAAIICTAEKCQVPTPAPYCIS